MVVGPEIRRDAIEEHFDGSLGDDEHDETVAQIQRRFIQQWCTTALMCSKPDTCRVSLASLFDQVLALPTDQIDAQVTTEVRLFLVLIGGSSVAPSDRHLLEEAMAATDIPTHLLGLVKGFPAHGAAMLDTGRRTALELSNMIGWIKDAAAWVTTLSSVNSMPLDAAVQSLSEYCSFRNSAPEEWAKAFFEEGSDHALQLVEATEMAMTTACRSACRAWLEWVVTHESDPPPGAWHADQATVLHKLSQLSLSFVTKAFVQAQIDDSRRGN